MNGYWSKHENLRHPTLPPHITINMTLAATTTSLLVFSKLAGISLFFNIYMFYSVSVYLYGSSTNTQYLKIRGWGLWGILNSPHTHLGVQWKHTKSFFSLSLHAWLGICRRPYLYFYLSLSLFTHLMIF
jgi:hypothetical protein